jgi:hypothetical protein
MAPITDSDLYARGAATLLASWQEYAGGSSGAALLHLNGVAAAVVPDDPERAVYNNALLDRDLGGRRARDGRRGDGGGVLVGRDRAICRVGA